MVSLLLAAIWGLVATHRRKVVQLHAFAALRLVPGSRGWRDWAVCCRDHWWQQ